MRLFLRYIFYIFTLIFTILIQVSFIKPLDDIFFNINILYIVILFLLFYGEIYLFIFWVIFGGFLWDYFGGFPFGMMLSMLLVAVFIMYGILTKFLTNRSIYALLLFLFVGICVYNITLYLFSFVVHLFGYLNFINSFLTVLKIILYQTILIFVSVLFFYLPFKKIYKYL